MQRLKKENAAIKKEKKQLLGIYIGVVEGKVTNIIVRS